MTWPVDILAQIGLVVMFLMGVAVLVTMGIVVIYGYYNVVWRLFMKPNKERKDRR